MNFKSEYSIKRSSGNVKSSLHSKHLNFIIILPHGFRTPAETVKNMGKGMQPHFLHLSPRKFAQGISDKSPPCP